jgi:hypothetical protein
MPSASHALIPGEAAVVASGQTALNVALFTTTESEYGSDIGVRYAMLICGEQPIPGQTPL